MPRCNEKGPLSAALALAAVRLYSSSQSSAPIASKNATRSPAVFSPM